jgi:hypothetical protein
MNWGNTQDLQEEEASTMQKDERSAAYPSIINLLYVTLPLLRWRGNRDAFAIFRFAPCSKKSEILLTSSPV